MITRVCPETDEQCVRDPQCERELAARCIPCWLIRFGKSPLCEVIPIEGAHINKPAGATWLNPWLRLEGAGYCLEPVTIRVHLGGTIIPDVPAWNQDASLADLTILNQVMPSIALAVPIDPELWMLADDQVWGRNCPPG